MTTQEKFLVDFHNDLQKIKPEDRKAYIQGCAKLLELREDAARREGRQQLAKLAERNQERADYFKPDVMVMQVDSLVWAASLPSAQQEDTNAS